MYIENWDNNVAIFSAIREEILNSLLTSFWAGVIFTTSDVVRQT